MPCQESTERCCSLRGVSALHRAWVETYRQSTFHAAPRREERPSVDTGRPRRRTCPGLCAADSGPVDNLPSCERRSERGPPERPLHHDAAPGRTYAVLRAWLLRVRRNALASSVVGCVSACLRRAPQATRLGERAARVSGARPWTPGVEDRGRKRKTGHDVRVPGLA